MPWLNSPVLRLLVSCATNCFEVPPAAVLACVAQTQGMQVASGMVLYRCRLVMVLTLGGFVLVCCRSGEQVVSTVKSKLKPTLLANWTVWPLAHVINFALVPPAQRILYINVVNVSLWAGVARGLPDGLCLKLPIEKCCAEYAIVHSMHVCFPSAGCSLALFGFPEHGGLHSSASLNMCLHRVAGHCA